MKASEVKENCYVKYNGKPVRVTADMIIYASSFDPIPISEKILEQLGFWRYDKSWMKDKGDTRLTLKKEGASWRATIALSWYRNLKSVHEVQMVWFGLFGEDLVRGTAR